MIGFKQWYEWTTQISFKNQVCKSCYHCSICSKCHDLLLHYEFNICLNFLHGVEHDQIKPPTSVLAGKDNGYNSGSSSDCSPQSPPQVTTHWWGHSLKPWNSSSNVDNTLNLSPICNPLEISLYALEINARVDKIQFSSESLIQRYPKLADYNFEGQASPIGWYMRWHSDQGFQDVYCVLATPPTSSIGSSWNLTNKNTFGILEQNTI